MGENTEAEANQKISELIMKAKGKNPILGHITVETHKITTNAEVFSPGRQYMVPTSIWLETKELLKDLKEKKLLG